MILTVLMFDIGFWELALIMVVALMVIGPDRLPGLARTAGLWFGKAQAMVKSVKADIDLELKAEDLKKKLSVQGVLHEFTDVDEEIRRLAELAKSGQPRNAGGQNKPQEDNTTS